MNDFYSRNIDSEIKNKVASYFGIKHLEVGQHILQNEDNAAEQILEPTFIWLASVQRFNALTPKGMRDLLVAVMKTTEWRRGLLLIPADSFLELEDEEYMGGDNIVPVDLSRDFLEEALTCANLSSTKHPPKSVISEFAHTFKLYVSTPITTIDMRVRTRFWDEDPQHASLWFSVDAVIQNLVEQYNRDDMRMFFKGKVW